MRRFPSAISTAVFRYIFRFVLLPAPGGVIDNWRPSAACVHLAVRTETWVRAGFPFAAELSVTLRVPSRLIINRFSLNARNRNLPHRHPNHG